MKLGLVTYMWAADWDLDTILKNCAATGFDGVELRSTHKHGVEPTLSKAERDEIRKKFADSPVKLLGPGSACEYHSPDHGVVRQNIDLTKRFLELSADLGGTGVKVRPNALVKGEPEATTIHRIAEALRECGEFAAGCEQEVRVEVHGPGTSAPSVMKKILDETNHPRVKICWNSNPGETIQGSIKTNFEMLWPHFGGTIHIHDLYEKSYPYAEFFSLLKARGYTGTLCSESPPTTDAVRVMHYYRALFDAMVAVA